METPPQTPTAAIEKTVIIRGTIQTPTANSGAIPAEYAGIAASDADSQQEGSRAAKPTFSYDDTRYFVSATAEGVSTAQGDVDASEKTFTIPLSLGHAWSITLEASDAQNDETILKATYTFDHNLTESDVSTPITLILEPMTDGTGKIELAFDDDNGLYDDVSVEFLNPTEADAWNAEVTPPQLLYTLTA
ncbi:MAG: hypothetical protein K5930_03980 [Treponemataceae bacterium]|nr:hypothetical protein [Treponemataceae bacterium]